MATGQKISAMTAATDFSGSDILPIVQSGTNKSLTHDVLMADTQICQAWVNFNGTGTVAIRDSFNVSSITDNGTGNYTINFTNNLSNANYSVFISANSGQQVSCANSGQSVSAVTGIETQTTSGGSADYDNVSVFVIGGVS